MAQQDRDLGGDDGGEDDREEKDCCIARVKVASTAAPAAISPRPTRGLSTCGNGKPMRSRRPEPNSPG